MAHGGGGMGRLLRQETEPEIRNGGRGRPGKGDPRGQLHLREPLREKIHAGKHKSYPP